MRKELCTFLILIIVLLSGCGLQDSDSKTITLYGFSAKEDVFNEEIIPKFRDYWQDKTGQRIKFETSFGGSEKITSQIMAGAKAEVAVLSTQMNAKRLQDKGLVTSDGNNLPFEGTLTTTPLVIITRKGNPKGISSFRDLAKEGIKLVLPDPRTSGGARWAILAIYGASLENGDKNPKEFLSKIKANITHMPDSERKAMNSFLAGIGDALITYESEALLMKERKRDLEIIYPNFTIFSEHKAVMIDKNVSDNERSLIKAFLEYLWQPPIQRVFCEYNFRSPDEKINQEYGYQTIEKAFTIDSFGGWPKAEKEIIEGIWNQIK